MGLVSTEMEKAEGKADLVDLRAEVGSRSEVCGQLERSRGWWDKHIWSLRDWSGKEI